MPLVGIELTSPDGTELVAEVTGSGPPVVFVHGSNGGVESWADIGARLTGYQVVRYARRNHQPSGVGPAPNSFTVEADDLQTVLQSVGRAHVVGGSYGATVALHTARADADRIASLALFEPPILLSGAHLMPVIEQYQRLFTTVRYADALELFCVRPPGYRPRCSQTGRRFPTIRWPRWPHSPIWRRWPTMTPTPHGGQTSVCRFC